MSFGHSLTEQGPENKTFKSAAKYQFLGEFLSEQKIPALSEYAVPAIRAKLGGNWAYYFLAPSDRILPIAFVNHRGLAPAYQRVLSRARLREIGEYLDSILETRCALISKCPSKTDR